MDDDHNCSFTYDVDRLSSVIEGYRSQTFQAELKIKGIYQHESEHLLDSSCEKELDLFQYIGNQHKKSIIRLLKLILHLVLRGEKVLSTVHGNLTM